MKRTKNVSADENTNIITNNEEGRWVNFQLVYIAIVTTKLTFPAKIFTVNRISCF